MEFRIDYVIGLLIVLAAFYFLYRKIRKAIQRGRCASCPVYDECEKMKKVDINQLK